MCIVRFRRPAPSHPRCGTLVAAKNQIRPNNLHPAPRETIPCGFVRTELLEAIHLALPFSKVPRVHRIFMPFGGAECPALWIRNAPSVLGTISSQFNGVSNRAFRVQRRYTWNVPLYTCEGSRRKGKCWRVTVKHQKLHRFKPRHKRWKLCCQLHRFQRSKLSVAFPTSPYWVIHIGRCRKSNRTKQS